ncbi:hypothetical protein FRB90_008873 [Tulasnella sp. 427]|nr:hypothetical protein FRB90_008873 [Tulasnella sp. 427]
MADSRTSQLNQRIVALANDGPSPSYDASQRLRPSVAIQRASEDGRVSTSSEAGISYVSCDDWRSSPPPAYSASRPPHYSLARHAAPPSPASPISPITGPQPPQTIHHQKSTSTLGRKLAGFFAPNEAADLDGLVGDFIHPKKPKQPEAGNSLAPGSTLEIAVEVVQEEWTTGARNGNGTRRASRFVFGGRNRNRDSEVAEPSS